MWLLHHRLAECTIAQPLRRVGVNVRGAHMIWTCLALISTTACSESSATAPDATAVMQAPVVVGLGRRVVAVGSKTKASSIPSGRNLPENGWRVISGGNVVGIDGNGMLVAHSSGLATIAARVGSVTWEMPVEVIPHLDEIDGAGLPSSQRARAQLPAVMLDFPWPTVEGRTIHVAAGGNLQAALNSAKRGDEIVLEAGAQFTGNYTLPAKAGTVADGWIVIRGDKSDRLPTLGTRVSPSDALLMPGIITNNTDPALRLAPGASGWRIVGLEVTVVPTLTQMHYGLVFLGVIGRQQSTLDSVPTDIVLDRMYIHAQSNTNITRCVSLNSARTEISDSYISDCHARGFDSQAIWGGNGPGPYKIVNNMLEGAGENVMFGGTDPAIPGLVPSDIEIRRNYIYTPIAWKGKWTRKNLLELKNASRVLIEANVFDGSWQDAQTGWAVIIKSANQSGNCSWCRSTDVTFRLNLVRNAGAGVNIAGTGDNPNTDSTARRVVIQESVFDNLGVDPYLGDRRGIQIVGSPADITVERTVISGTISAALMLDNREPTERAVFRDNVWAHGMYGAIASGAGSGTAALNAGAPRAIWDKMVFVGPQRSGYPVGTGFVSSERDAHTAARVRAAVDSATAGVVR